MLCLFLLEALDLFQRQAPAQGGEKTFEVFASLVDQRASLSPFEAERPLVDVRASKERTARQVGRADKQVLEAVAIDDAIDLGMEVQVRISDEENLRSQVTEDEEFSQRIGPCSAQVAADKEAHDGSLLEGPLQ